LAVDGLVNAREGVDLQELLERVGLSPEARAALETWRGHLPPPDQ
jgi:hypothetical protein